MSEASPSSGAPGAAGAQSSNGVPAQQPSGAQQSEQKAGEAKPGEQKVDPPKRKVKVDGQELEVTDDELVKGFQLEKTSRSRMEQAKKESEAAKKLEAALKSPTAEALRTAGWTDEQIEDLAIQTLSKKHAAAMEEERKKKLSPEQKELEELRALKDQNEKDAKQREEEGKKAAVDNATAAVTEVTIQTLQLLPEKLRGSNEVAAMTLDVWDAALSRADELKKAGVNLTPQWVADQVTKRLRGIARELLTNAKDEDLEELMPPNLRARLGKAKTNEHPALTAQPQVRDKKPDAESKPPRVTQAQLMRRIQTGR